MPGLTVNRAVGGWLAGAAAATANALARMRLWRGTVTDTVRGPSAAPAAMSIVACSSLGASTDTARTVIPAPKVTRVWPATKLAAPPARSVTRRLVAPGAPVRRPGTDRLRMLIVPTSVVSPVTVLRTRTVAVPVSRPAGTRTEMRRTPRVASTCALDVAASVTGAPAGGVKVNSLLAAAASRPVAVTAKRAPGVTPVVSTDTTWPARAAVGAAAVARASASAASRNDRRGVTAPCLGASNEVV